MDPVIAYIGLGSNLGDPTHQVIKACQAINQCREISAVKLSPMYQSKAVGPAGQPDYINAAAEISTTLSPIALLDLLQTIEHAQQRVRVEHWGSRTLDLDLLLYGVCTITTPRLTVPHAYLEQRNFVLAPLADLAPELRLPSGAAISELLANIGMGDLRRWPEFPVGNAP